MTSAAVKRVCILGAESTGKTTLAETLAARYETVWVPEYGAIYHHAARGDPHRPWTADEFVHIAVIQNWLEDFLARFARRVLFCDTDVFVTAVFAELYLGERVPAVQALVRSYDLYLVCDVHTPFERDALGLRREDARRRMHDAYVEHAREGGRPWAVLSGPHEERVASASALVDELLS